MRNDRGNQDLRRAMAQTPAKPTITLLSRDPSASCHNSNHRTKGRNQHANGLAVATDVNIDGALDSPHVLARAR
jgi:hypothetical protein